MRVTDIRLELVTDRRLRAYLDLELDRSFAVRDLKLVEPESGRFVLAFPSKSRTAPCAQCRRRRPINKPYCPDCGFLCGVVLLTEGMRPEKDMAHPLTPQVRIEMTTLAVEAWGREVELAKQPGYECRRYFGRDDARLQRRIEQVFETPAGQQAG